MPRVRIEIDTLAVTGLQATAGETLRGSIERELARLVEAEAPPSRRDPRDMVRVGVRRDVSGLGVTGVGAEVARAVHRGIDR